MENKNANSDRRKYPRINRRLQFQMEAEDFDLVTHSLNLSCNGASIRVNRSIAPMTNLKIALALPSDANKDETEYLECSGVVVRSEQLDSASHSEDIYDIAVFFSAIGDNEKEKIANFLAS